MIRITLHECIYEEPRKFYVVAHHYMQEDTQQAIDIQEELWDNEELIDYTTTLPFHMRFILSTAFNTEEEALKELDFVLSYNEIIDAMGLTTNDEKFLVGEKLEKKYVYEQLAWIEEQQKKFKLRKYKNETNTN